MRKVESSARAPAVEIAAAPPKRGGFWSWLWQASQTVVVVAALIGIAAWGHSTDWTLPKFSALMGEETSEATDWCEAHNVPESICVECNPSLLQPESDFGWCAVHGVMQCPFEHPELAQTKAPVTITPAMLERAQRAIAVRPRAENNSRCLLHRKRIQFETPAALEKAGVDIAIVSEKPVVEAISANGEIVYDETRTAHLSSRVAGTIYRVAKKIGDRVEKGEILALIEGADVGQAKSDLLRAISQLRLKKSNVERLRPLAGNAVPGQVFMEAETEANDAAIAVNRAIQTLVNQGLPINAEEFAELSNEEIANRLQVLGLPTDIVLAEGTTTASSNLLPLRAPMSGVIVSRSAVEGEVVATNTPLFDVTDTSHLWLNLNLRQQDAKYVSYGQPVLFRTSDGTSEPEYKGTVTWISTGADDLTRTVKVRVDLPNADGRLRANTFGTGRIVLRDEPKAIVVPSEAIHWDGTCSVVFVRDRDFFTEGAPKIFHVRSVRVGVKDDATTEVIAGLLPGEVIASKNSVVLEAQLLKENLGAGCGCCEGK
jgi:cobalt-zinc-cadmium efflux system membrane fusion protein